jgi:uncharacterized membrane protein YccC
MGGSKRQYMWNVAGFVSVIIGLEPIPVTENAFSLAIVRTLETGLGILCYTLVALLVWPTSTAKELDTAVRQLAATQRQLYQGYLDLLGGKGRPEGLQPLRVQEAQQIQHLGQALTGAGEDTYEVWEMRREWQRYAAQAGQVMEALERWCESFDEVRPLDLESLIVDYRPLTGELATRFRRIEPMLSGRDSGPRPPAHAVSLNVEGVRALSHFERAALALFETQLRNLEFLTREMLDTLAQIIRGSSTWN